MPRDNDSDIGVFERLMDIYGATARVGKDIGNPTTMALESLNEHVSTIFGFAGVNWVKEGCEVVVTGFHVEGLERVFEIWGVRIGFINIGPHKMK